MPLSGVFGSHPYYERRGLLAEPDRTLGGHRLYPEVSVTVVRVIKAAQRLGFTLDEVAQLLEGTQVGSRRRGDGCLRERVGDKLAEVDAELTELRDTLRAALAAGCEDLIACSVSPSCPVPFDPIPETATVVPTSCEAGRCGC